MNESGRAMVLDVVAGYFFLGRFARHIVIPLLNPTLLHAPDQLRTTRIAGVFVKTIMIHGTLFASRSTESYRYVTSKFSSGFQVLCRLDQKLLGVKGSPGGWANMDFLQTGGKGCDTPLSHCPGMTDSEYRTEFSIWSLTQSPLIVDTVDFTMAQHFKR